MDVVGEVQEGRGANRVDGRGMGVGYRQQVWRSVEGLNTRGWAWR